MIVLQESNTTQTFSFIPRYYTGVELKLKNEMSGKIDTYVVSPEIVGYYHQITEVVDLVEGNFYSLALYDGDGNIVYRDRIFCTNQTIEDYTINKNEYTENTTDNEFIIYE